MGSVVAKTDANGNVVERTTFEPYGAVVGDEVGDGPGYTGHVSDATTRLSYMQQRYYDPGVGLFLSVDQVTAYGNPVGQLNRYRYAKSNPYRFTDPDGRQSWSNTGTANSWPAVQQACGGSNSCEQEVAWNLAKAEAKTAFTAYGGATVPRLLRAIAAPFLRTAVGEAQGPTLAGVKVGNRPSDTRAALEGAGYKGGKNI
nr:RHS repeat-associated core domain-containing protein [Stenotrophomonas tumulicola]